MDTRDAFAAVLIGLGWAFAAAQLCAEDVLPWFSAGAHRLGARIGGMGREIEFRIARRRDTGARATLADVCEMVDIVRLGLLAGLSFDAALETYCVNKRGILARELDCARLSWQMGLATREDALRQVAERTGVRALETVAGAVGQAHLLGAPLADTLARQGAEMRMERRAQVEREIERAPVKLLIPTGTLILPALLLSILGPLLASSGMI